MSQVKAAGRVNELKRLILNDLHFERSKATGVWELSKKYVKNGSFTGETFNQAIDELLEEKKVIESNGWFLKVRIIKHNLTQDDIDWFHGAGYYAQ